jgi:hypothetical protein
MIATCINSRKIIKEYPAEIYGITDQAAYQTKQCHGTSENAAALTHCPRITTTGSPSSCVLHAASYS